MTLKHHIEYTGVCLLMRIAGLLSPSRGVWIGERMGDLAFDLVRKRRDLVKQHLGRVFGNEHEPDALHKLARNVYRQLGRLATEHARLLAAETTDIRDRITVIGDDHIAQARRQGKGVILVTGHFGYWELLGASVAALGYPMAVVAKDQHNPAVNTLIIKGREKLGMKVISMAAATHAIMRALRRNECVGLLMDQDAGPGGTFVDFLGLEASTYQGPALFALRSGAPIIPCFIIREGAEHHRIVFESPIEAVPTGDEIADIQRYTQTYTAVLERYVRTYPDHWFWVHRRWKTRPAAV
ncbi:MAG: lysophospholipid acyltransferase family protein [Candidatus Latescibacteria bacterium]|jgi:KDO2-lipid IV(A) lauroyltransferase|nr:lysophospholipid acyltransferase family protein [Candidatus Latescibacterota bacterium]